MSATTCARSGGAALFAAARGLLHDQPERAGYLERMQAEQDALAAVPWTDHRVNQPAVNDAWAAHARKLRAGANR